MGFPALLGSMDRAALALLGESILYSPSVGAPATVVGIHDLNYVLVDTGHVGTSSVSPAVFLRLSDLPSDPEVDETLHVTARGVQYAAREVKKDGLGGVLILLTVP